MVPEFVCLERPPWVLKDSGALATRNHPVQDLMVCIYLTANDGGACRNWLRQVCNRTLVDCWEGRFESATEGDKNIPRV